MAELGTPENPEIIDPSMPPPRPALAARWRVARQILLWLAAISMPGVIFDLLCYSLVQMAIASGGVLPWVLLTLIAPPAVLFSMIALAASLILLPAFVFALLGKAQRFSINDVRLQRFVRFR